MDSLAGTIARSSDGLDDLTEEQTPQGAVTYTYDLAGRRLSMAAASQATVKYAWDNASRLIGITQGTASVGFSYDAANRRTQLTLPNGMVLAYSYDNDSHVTGMTWNLGTTQLGNLTYGYDADGRVTVKGGSFAQVNLPAAATGNTFNADNAMTAFNGAALTYDANGNLTSDGTYTYTWDARGHLSTLAGTNVAAYQYDAFGRRTQNTLNGLMTQYLYDGLNPVEEFDGTSPPNPTATMLTGLGIDRIFPAHRLEGTLSYLTDMLGSTMALADSSGALDTTYTYDPFGNVTVNGADTNPYQFTGRENDDTGLYYYRARYYSPTLQRFVSQDPIGFRAGDPDLYGYVKEYPISASDPLGLSGYFLRFFVDIGAGFEVGTNPDGTWFATVDFGFGEDVAAGYDANATSPGYGQNGPSSCSIGSFAGAGVHIGALDLGLGGETGTDFGQNGAAPYSSSGPSATVSGPLTSGVEFGGSAGGRIGFAGP